MIDYIKIRIFFIAESYDNFLSIIQLLKNTKILIFIDESYYDHFEGASGLLWEDNKSDMPRACKYAGTKGQTNEKAAQLLFDRILPHDITWRPFEDYRDVIPFAEHALYSGWIRNGSRKIKYLPERALRQFGYVQSIPRHPEQCATIMTTLDQVDEQWAGYQHRVLTTEMLGSRVVLPTDTVSGYMDWYLKISHSYIIPIPEGYTVRLVQIGTVVQEEAPSQSQTESRLGEIQRILKELMSSDEIANDSRVYQCLKDAEELTIGLTYVRRGGSGSGSGS
jgi:hypothetical protein